MKKKKITMTYKAKDVLKILPNGNTKSTPLLTGKDKYKKVKTIIKPMDQYRFYCILGNCKFKLMDQEPKSWSTTRQHQSTQHGQNKNVELDKLVLPAYIKATISKLSSSFLSPINEIQSSITNDISSSSYTDDTSSSSKSLSINEYNYLKQEIKELKRMIKSIATTTPKQSTQSRIDRFIPTSSSISHVFSLRSSLR